MSLSGLIVGVFSLINIHLVQPTILFIWSKFEPHYDISKKAAVAFLIAFNVISVSLCMSAFMFGTFYFYHMPTVYHSFPLNFVYNRSCIENHKIYETNAKHFSRMLYVDECYPQSQIDLSSPKHNHLLQEGQPYSIVIRLQLPETKLNMEIGMFMVKMAVVGKEVPVEKKPVEMASDENERNKNSWFYGKAVSSKNVVSFSSERAASLQHTSALIKLIKLMFSWPLYAIGLKKETQNVDVVLFEEMVLEKKNFMWHGMIYLDHPAIMVTSSYMDVTAQFKGIQYFLYLWPVVSFIAGTTLFFFPVLFVVSMLAYFFIWRSLFTETVPAPTPTRHRNTRRQHPPQTLQYNGQEGPADCDLAEITPLVNDQLQQDTRTVSRRSSSSSIEMLGQAPTPENQDDMISSQVSFVMTPSLTISQHGEEAAESTLPPCEEAQGNTDGPLDATGEPSNQLRFRGVES